MLGFLNRDELAEFGRLRDLALPNRFGVRFEHAEDFVAHMRIAAKQAGAGLIEDARHQRLHVLELLTGPRQRRGVVASVASGLPAIRAARTDPWKAIRSQ